MRAHELLYSGVARFCRRTLAARQRDGSGAAAANSRTAHGEDEAGPQTKETAGGDEARREDGRRKQGMAKEAAAAVGPTTLPTTRMQPGPTAPSVASPFQEVPTAAVSTGINIADHDIIFDGLKSFFVKVSVSGRARERERECVCVCVCE